MKQRFINYIKHKKLLCILVGIYIILCGICLIYIQFNGQQVVSTNSPIVKIAQKLGLGDPVVPSNKTTDTLTTSNNRSGSNSSGSNGTSTNSLSDELVDFVAFYADTQQDTNEEDSNHQRVANYILSTGANPVFHAGDIMEDGTQNSLDRFSAATTVLRKSRVFYAALGNNDRQIGDSSTPSQLWLSFFNFPGNERWYSIDLGTLHLIVLDSAFSSLAPGSSQYNWLVSDLQSQNAQSRIIGVMFHHPTAYNSIASLLSQEHVDFTIAGHVHSYSHSISNDIHNFTLSGQPSVGYILVKAYTQNVLVNVYNDNNELIETIDFKNR